MTKKRHHPQPKIKLSSHAKSKIQRQARIQRWIVIASAIFLGIIGVAVAIGLYIDRIAPMNETVLRVNGRSFTMGYYVDTLKLYSAGMDASQLSMVADSITAELIRNEIVRQGALAEGIVITSAQIRDEIRSAGVEDNRVMRDLVEASLASEQLHERFLAALPPEKEQVRFEIMVVESRSAAGEVEAAVLDGVTLIDLSEEYSANPDIPVVHEWAPYELLASTDVASALAEIDPGATSVIHDPNAAKNVGYWIIEIVDRDDAGAIKPRVILAGSLEEALRAKERLETEDFVTIAAQYSQIHDTFPDAELDWITPEDVVTEAFNEVVFDLELNEISEPIRETEIQTSGAYWVVRLLERETRAMSANVADALASAAFDEWYQPLSRQAVVEQLMTTAQKNWAIERVLS